MSIDKIANSARREESKGRRYIGPLTRYALILLTAYSVIGCKKEPAPKAETRIASQHTDLYSELNQSHLLGWYFFDRGFYEDAISRFSKAIRIDPNYSSAHFGLGRAHMALGNNQDALGAFTVVIELDPNNGMAYLDRSNVHKKLGNVDSMSADLKMAHELGAYK